MARMSHNVGLSLSLALFAAAGVATVTPDAHAQTRYQRVIGTANTEAPNAIIQTRDQGSLFVGRRQIPGAGQVIWVMKLDATGATEWERVIDNPLAAASDDVAHSVVQTEDGGYAISGDVTAGPAGLYTAILKLSPTGNLVWGRLYFGNNLAPDPRTSRIIEMPNRDVVVVSRYRLNANVVVPTIIRLNAAGAQVFAWGFGDNRYIDTNQGGLLDVRAVRNTSTIPDIAAVGWTARNPASNREALIIRVDGAGNPQFFRTYNQPADTSMIFTGMDDRTVGDFIVTSRQYNGANPLNNTTLYLLNNAFNPVLHRIYPNFVASQASVWDRGQVIGMGGTFINPAGAPLPQMALVRLDGANGNVLSAINYGSPQTEEGRSLFPTVDDGWLLAGTTNGFFTFGGLDGYVIKSDEFGRSGCNENLYPQAATFLPEFRLDVPFTRLGLQFSNWQPDIRDGQSLNRVLCLRLCPADYNEDGVVDFFDYLDFVADFDLGNADYNGDSTTDFFDYLDFVADFDAGCE
jgi:hypothetical protein